jgi:hypothetical protein
MLVRWPQSSPTHIYSSATGTAIISVHFVAVFTESKDNGPTIQIFVFNLCGEYVCQDPDYVGKVATILPYIHLLFGNIEQLYFLCIS